MNNTTPQPPHHLKIFDSQKVDDHHIENNALIIAVVGDKQATKNYLESGRQHILW
jgi:hypothetical protein